MTTPPAAALETIGTELRRIGARLDGAAAARADAAAVVVRPALQLLADTAQGIELRQAKTPPSARTVPVLPAAALADQVAVLGHDLVAAATACTGGTDGGPDPAVWSGGTRAPLGEVLAAVSADLTALRRAL